MTENWRITCLTDFAGMTSIRLNAPAVESKATLPWLENHVVFSKYIESNFYHTVHVCKDVGYEY